jgi:hypothetical protein
MTLTGRFNFRRSLFGRLMLEVEEEVKPFFASDKKPVKRRWRKATLIDLAQPEMRALIDLRFQPQFMARTSARLVDLPAGGPARSEDHSSVVTMLPRGENVPQRTSH